MMKQTMISEIYNILKKDGFDVEIGNGIIITKNGFKYTMNGNKFIKIVEIMKENSLGENDILIDGAERINKNHE